MIPIYGRDTFKPFQTILSSFSSHSFLKLSHARPGIRNLHPPPTQHPFLTRREITPQRRTQGPNLRLRSPLHPPNAGRVPQHNLSHRCLGQRCGAQRLPGHGREPETPRGREGRAQRGDHVPCRDGWERGSAGGARGGYWEAPC